MNEMFIDGTVRMQVPGGKEHYVGWNKVSVFFLCGKTQTYKKRGAEAIQRSSCSQKLSKL